MKKIILIAILVIFAGILYFSGGLYYGWTGKYERAGVSKNGDKFEMVNLMVTG